MVVRRVANRRELQAVAGINDLGSLKDWVYSRSLDQNRALAGVILPRALLRVLPIFWGWAISGEVDESKTTLLPVLRMILMLTLPKSEIPEDLFGHASTAVRDPVRLTGKSRSSVGFFGIALSAGVQFPEISDDRLAGGSLATVVGEAGEVARERGAEKLYWSAFQTDCQKFLGNKEVLHDSLWANNENPFAKIWRQVKDRNEREADSVNQWEFWIKWYDGVLQGAEPDWNLLRQVALIEPEVWDAGPEAVADEIAVIELKAAANNSPNAEDIRINADGLFEAVPRSDLPSKTLKDANERLADIVQQIRGCQHMNQYSALGPEADVLETYLDRYSDNPLRLYEGSQKVVRHIGNLVTEGALPENDNVVGDVSNDLQNTADDIYNFDAEVSQTVDARAKRRYENLSPEQKLIAHQVTEVVAENSVEALAFELTEDRRVIEDDSASKDDQAESRYRWAGRMARIVLVSMVNGTSNVIKALEKLGSVAGGVTTLAAIIRLILGLL